MGAKNTQVLSPPPPLTELFVFICKRVVEMEGRTEQDYSTLICFSIIPEMITVARAGPIGGRSQELQVGLPCGYRDSSFGAVL